MITQATMEVVRELVRVPPPEREYSGFPWWHALLVQPNREERAAERLQRVHVHVYLPQWTRQVRCGGRVHRHRPRLSAVIPGMLFVPEEIIDVPKRDDLFEFANVRGFMRLNGTPARIRKDDIEKVREMEALLNLPPPVKPVVTHKVADRVRFTNELYAIFWGTGTVFEVVSAHRIGVEVDHLFGRKGKVYVPAHEIEAM